MFYACLVVMTLFCFMIACLALSIYDLELYNFGLYYVILCIVGIMICCAFCVAQPDLCRNPLWYAKFMEHVEERYSQHYSTPGRSTGGPEKAGDADDRISASRTDQPRPAMLGMLGPAMALMHQVYRGVAWVQDEISEETTPQNVHNATPRESFLTGISSDVPQPIREEPFWPPTKCLPFQRRRLSSESCPLIRQDACKEPNSQTIVSYCSIKKSTSFTDAKLLQCTPILDAIPAFNRGTTLSVIENSTCIEAEFSASDVENCRGSSNTSGLSAVSDSSLDMVYMECAVASDQESMVILLEPPTEVESCENFESDEFL